MDEIEKTEEEIIPEVEIEEAPEPSLREQLHTALEETKEPKEEKPAKSRDETGKFAKTAKASPAVVEPVVETPEVQLPKGYSKTVEQAWKDIPPAIKAELAKRDSDYHKELTKHDEERAAGRQFKEAFMPYMAQLRAEGAEPLQVVQSFLNTAHILRTGTPEQKAKILIDTARQFGINPAVITQAQQGQQRVDPVINQLLQRQQQLEGYIQNQQATVQQQTQAKLVDLVNSFVSDTTNYPHFIQVEAEMMALLQGNMFQDLPPDERLKKVYDYAVHANPQTRSTLMQTAQQQSLGQRVASQKAKADAARKAGSSIKGKPGMLASTNQNTGGPLREQLRSAMNEAREA